ncbi:MAG: hypothetical protein ACLUN9_14450 [Enterocloster aldenensis]
MLKVTAIDPSSISIHTTFVGGDIYTICVIRHMGPHSNPYHFRK